MVLLLSIDTSILFAIQDYLRCAFLDFLMPAVSALGNRGFIWIAIALVCLYVPKYRRCGLTMLFALLLSMVIGDGLLKPLFARMRPCNVMPWVPLLIPRPYGFSFPSGHTATSFAAAFVLLITNKKAGVFAFILAFLIAFSRLYLFVHYPSDVIGGIVLGLLVGKITLTIAFWIQKHIFFNNKNRTRNGSVFLLFSVELALKSRGTASQ